MRRTYIMLFALAFGFYSCNPDCDSVQRLKLSTDLNPAGYEVLVTANPISSLKGRRVYFGKAEVETKFNNDVGLIVTVPEGISGVTDLRVEDPDCVDFISMDFNVVEGDFFQNNTNFIFPPAPEIVIPTIPGVFPPTIENAWLSPVNSDYCLWFGPFQPYHFIVNGDTLFTDDTFIVAAGSFELSACGNTNAYYHNNPFYGIVNYQTGEISITIDRSSKGLGTEEFTGEFIDMQNTAYGQPTLEVCGSAKEKAGHMIMLTSKTNGRQLLVQQPK